VMSGNIIIAVAHVMCLYLWWQILRKREVPVPRRQPAASQN
jgi:hypothetical protein